MTEQTKTEAEASIRQLDARCWVLRRDPEGRHWLTRKEALKDAWAAEIEQLPAPCWVGECAGCGEDMGDDDRFSQVHFDTRQDLAAHAEVFEWQLHGDELFHPDCVPAAADSPAAAHP